MQSNNGEIAPLTDGKMVISLVVGVLCYIAIIDPLIREWAFYFIWNPILQWSAVIGVVFLSRPTGIASQERY